MTLTERLHALAGHVVRERGRRDAVLDTVRTETLKAEVREAESVRIGKAIEVIQAATETRRQELKDRVENLVTNGLRAVFHRDDFEFAFEVSVQRNVMGAVPVLRSRFGDHDLETGIVDGHGGGVADVVSFLLRVIVLTLSRPRVAPVMVLDEAFRNVSPEYLRGVGVLLGELSRSADVQFVLVTHKDQLLDAADVIYRATLKDGKTSFDLEHATRDRSYHSRPQRGQTAPDGSSAFDHQDLVAKEGDYEPLISKTADTMAKRQRRKKKRTKAKCLTKQRKK